MEDNSVEEEDDKLYVQYEFETDPKQSLVRIDKFLVSRIEKITRSKVQRAIDAGLVLVNDKKVKANHKLKPGSKIVANIPKPKGAKHIVPENIPLDIVYEDDDLLIVNKAAGMVVHPGIGNYSGTLVNALAYYLNPKSDNEMPIMDGNEADRPGLVHRIDKNTSGLLVIAKTEEAMTHLAAQFFDHSIEREYIAIIWGEPDEEEGTITGNIGRHPNHRMQMTVFPDGEEGKHAVTHFKVLERYYYISLVSCKLETGRTHQIRVHFKHKGHPLFNDERYGGNRVIKGTVFSKYKRFVENTFDLIPRQALHAKSLGFIHPRTGEKMFFETEMPDDMKAALDKWRHYLEHRKK